MTLLQHAQLGYTGFGQVSSRIEFHKADLIRLMRLHGAQTNPGDNARLALFSKP